MLLASGFYATGLFLASLIPQVMALERAGGGVVSGFDKILHFAGFLGLAILLLIGLRLSERQRGRGFAILLTLAISGFYGVAHEAVQGFLPGHVVSPWDVLANILGIVVGAFIGELLVSRRIGSNSPADP